tara:strand:+ start:488 stop:1396 length:909 start_codon:yes stop_codon:yes gene_type:complete
LKGEDPGKEALEKQADEARETDLHKNLIRIASEFPPGSTERRDILALLKEAEESDAQDAEAAEDRAQADESKAEAEQDEAEADEVKEASEKGAKEKLPEKLKKHQFTSEDNPNPKGNDKDGDGETNEPSPLKGKKATLERVAATLKEGTTEHTALLKLIAGCEKLPEGPMRDNCEKKKKEGEESDKDDEKSDKKAAEKTASLEKQAASYRSTLIKAASILPVGSDERKTMLTSIKTADKWIQDAIKRPGRLHKFFGIPEGKDIPVAKIKGEIEKLKKKKEKTPEDKSLMGALQLGLRLKAME